MRDSRLLLPVTVACAAAAVACVAVFWRHGASGDAGLQHWLAVHTGTYNEPGDYYGFWSGFGSDIAEIAIIGGLISLYQRHNCHEKGCWRIGRHLVEGTPWCNHHHGRARTASLPAESPLERKFDLLTESVSDLADAIRAAILADRPRRPARGADGPVSGGAGSDPAKSEGLPADTAAAPAADGPVVPPPASRNLQRPKVP